MPERNYGFLLSVSPIRGDAHSLEPALATHQAALESKIRQLAGTIESVRNLRANLAQGRAPNTAVRHKSEQEFALGGTADKATSSG